MNKLKKLFLASALSMFCSSSTLAGGIPVIDPSMITNDTMNWIQDTMTELSHHIESYETLINQYETMYNQFNYIQNQYKGLVDTFQNIHNPQDMLNAYKHAVSMYQNTVNAYNNFATTTNQNFANLCEKHLSSQTMGGSACSAEVEAFLKEMNEANEAAKKDSDPSVEGSTAQQMMKTTDDVNKFLDEVEKRGKLNPNQDAKEGQLLTDLRSSTMLMNKQLVTLAQQQVKTTEEIKKLNQKLDEDKAEKLLYEERRHRRAESARKNAEEYKKLLAN